MDRSRVLPILRTIGVILALIALSIAWRGLGAADWLDRHVVVPTRSLGPLGWIAVVFIYALATVCLIPGSALTLAIGDLYGVPLGTILVLFGANLGASISFFLAKTVARRAVLARFDADRRFQAIDRAIAKRGALIVLLLRLSPVVPFNLLNYALGATAIRWRSYLVAGFVGMLPGTLLYVSIGSAVLGRRSSLASGWWILGLLVTLFTTLFLSRIAGEAIKNVGIES